MTDVSYEVKGSNGAKGTYKYMGQWSSIDHILISEGMKPLFRRCIINDQSFLLEDDTKFNGKKPFRTYQGYKYLGGIVHAIEKKKEVVTIDWRYAILVFFWRIIPRWLWVRLRITSK